MTAGELIFANIVDQRVHDAYGDRGQSGIYLSGRPGRALPFVVYRAWKVPTGVVSEEIRFVGPSGRTVHRWGPHVRRMLGSMDLTEERDLVEGAHFDEDGTFLASFIIDGEIVGEVQVPVYVQAAPDRLPKEVEDGLKKSDVIWVGVARAGRRITAPVWFAYKGGRILVLSKDAPGPEEQTVPGVPGVGEVVVITRRKGRDTSLDEFYASVRPLEGPEWEQAAKILADRRRSRVGGPAESIARWRGSCTIAELTPIVKS